MSYATKNYPQPEGTPNFDLLEACGGVGSNSGMMPGECTPGVMRNVSNSEVPYVRLVFTPHGHTVPVVLAMINVLNNTVDHMYIDQPWMEDNQMLMFWNTSISLTDAHDLYR